MLEIKLITVFAVCTAFLFVYGIMAVKSVCKAENEFKICIMLPVGADTADIEFLVRSCVYRAAEQYPETVAVLYNMGAKDETIRIFERLMQYKCRYYVVNSHDGKENVCKITDNVI